MVLGKSVTGMFGNKKVPVYEAKDLYNGFNPEATITGDGAELHGFETPVYFNKPTGSVKGIFAVALTDKQRSGYDVLVKTGEGSIKTYLQLQGTVPRPATVRLETRNNKIRANLPTHVEDQVVHFAARSAHGDVTIGLARGYCGLLVIETFAGGISRTKDVKQSCKKIKDKHIPSAPFCMDTYYVCPQGFTSKDIDTETLESLDVCKVKTYQGNINVAYIDELNVTDANVDEVDHRCTVS